MMCLDMIVVTAFVKRGVERNSCTTWQWLYSIKLLNTITVEHKTLQSLLSIKKCLCPTCHGLVIQVSK